MLTPKTQDYLRDYCPEDLHGRCVVVTGANSGIGFKACEELVHLGASVIMACRNIRKAESARTAILESYPDANIRCMTLDLASRNSIHSFVQQIISEGQDIHAFVNNAGVLNAKGRTAEGFEVIIGTNYIGTWTLTEAILPYLQSLGHEVRLINTSSIAHKAGSLDYGNFFFDKGYGRFKAYSRSKLCVTKYSLALHSRLEGSNVKLYLSHPGTSLTPIATNALGSWTSTLVGIVGRWIIQSPEKSALSIPYIVAGNRTAGQMYGPAGILEAWGYPGRSKISRKALFGWDELQEFTTRLVNG